MALSLGVDTGGTYTDAVILRDEREVLASAKALTTRHDLSLGIAEAVARVLAGSGVTAQEIGLAALSTTLATNALVEGQGGRIGFVAIGFQPNDLEKHGLSAAMRGDPVLHLAGGHNHAGGEAAALDLDALASWLADLDPVTGFAVAAQFATRNPAHETAAAELCRAHAPVSMSHDLSAKLGGPKRAMTAILNARLIGLTHRLIGRAEEALLALGISAPLMVVRGDGALMSAAQAKARPIETILSGPAASLVGAHWLTGAGTALVSDIGGTTTDVALLRDGKPAIDPDGARVGPYRTMVEAVAMRTHGLGGDSEVSMVESGLSGRVTLGPRRLIPVSLIALEARDTVHATLDEQLRAVVPSDHDGRFLRRVAGVEAGGLDPREAGVLERIEGVVPMRAALRNRMDQAALGRLVARGLVQMAGLTPSDAAHMLGLVDAWDRAAAEKALLLMARRRAGSGNRLAETAEEMAGMIVAQLREDTGLVLLEAAFAEEGDFGQDANALARHVLMQRGLEGHRGLVRLETGLNVPVIGLGASAQSYYPPVGARLRCDMLLPEHGPVANAIGAVVGRVTVRREGTVTAPSEGRYRAHLDSGPEDFADALAALARMEAQLRGDAEDAVRAAGASDIQIGAVRDIRQAEIEARQVFVEATIRVEASGRPRVARL